jgi:hypothetical protein
LPKYLRAALAGQQVGRIIHDDQVLTVQRPTL